MDNDTMPDQTRLYNDEPPPFLRTWLRVYLAVIVYTVILLVTLYLLTLALAP